MLNRVILVGRLTKDPEIRYTSTNIPVATFTMAVSRPFTNQATGDREADFIQCVVWRKQAENLVKFVGKGGLIGIDGRLQTRTYDDKDGQRRYITEVVCDTVSFLESKGSGSSTQEKENSNDYNDSSIAFSDEDLPF